MRSRLTILAVLVFLFLGHTFPHAEEKGERPTLNKLFERAHKASGADYVKARTELLARGQEAKDYLHQLSKSASTKDRRWLAEIIMERARIPDEFSMLERTFYEKCLVYRFGGPLRDTGAPLSPGPNRRLLFPGEPNWESSDYGKSWFDFIHISSSYRPMPQLIGEVLLKGWIPPLPDPHASGEGLHPLLKRALSSSNKRQRADKQIYESHALLLLSMLGERRAAPHIQQIVADKRKGSYLRIAAVRALGRGALKYTGALETLFDVATDDQENRGLREASVKAIEQIGDAKAIPRLKKLVKQSNSADVVQQAQRAISAIELKIVMAFHFAVRKGELAKVKQLLSSDPTLVNRRNQYKVHPLYYAASNGRTSVAKLLLDRGAEVDARSGGITPLHMACRGGRTKTVTLLLDRGADPKTTDHRGNTLLLIAVRRFHSDTVKALLDHGVDPNTQHVLHHALSLMIWASNVTQHAERERRGKELVTRYKRYRVKSEVIAKMLITHKKTNLNVIPPRSTEAALSTTEAALHMAARYGWVDLAKLLLARGADVDVRTKPPPPWRNRKPPPVDWGAHNDTPLHLAVWWGQDEMVKLLLKHGADRKARNSVGTLTGPVAGQPKLIKTLGGGHTDGISSVTFSPGGKTLASGSKDRSIRLWDVATGKNTATLIGHTDSVSSVAFSPDGKTLASGSGDKSIKLWDVVSGKNTATLKGQKGHVSSVALSPDGKTLASGSGDKSIKLWDVATGTNTATLQGHGGVRSVAFSPDGKTLASGSKSIKLWDVATRKNFATLAVRSGAVSAVAFSPDGKTLAWGNRGRIKLWDVSSKNTATKRHLRILPRRSTRRTIVSVAFSPDGKTLASGGGWVKLWDVASGKNTATLRRHIDAVWSVAFSPDGKTLASGSWGKIKLWDVAPGKKD